MRNSKIKKMTSLAMFLALAILLNYVENLIPIDGLLPGMKLGLANTMNLIILYFYGRKEYFSIGLLRVIMISLLFNGLFSNAFFLSLSGFLLSSIIVIFLSLIKKLSVFSLSISSAVFHGIGQILCAIVLYYSKDGSSFYLVVYLPALIISGAITGTLIGFICSITINRLEKINILNF